MTEEELLWAGFKPDQPRDANGRFVKGAGTERLTAEEKGRLIQHAHEGHEGAQAALKAHAKGMHGVARKALADLPKTTKAEDAKAAEAAAKSKKPKATKATKAPALIANEVPKSSDHEKKIVDAYHALKKERGLSNVGIEDLHNRSGVPLKEFHDFLRAESKTGNANPTRGEPTVWSDERRAKALTFPGSPHEYGLIELMGRHEKPTEAHQPPPEAPSPKPARSGSRASGTNPRALGTNPRALKENPRALGTNPRALEAAEQAKSSKQNAFDEWHDTHAKLSQKVKESRAEADDRNAKANEFGSKFTNIMLHIKHYDKWKALRDHADQAEIDNILHRQALQLHESKAPEGHHATLGAYPKDTSPSAEFRDLRASGIAIRDEHSAKNYVTKKERYKAEREEWKKKNLLSIEAKAAKLIGSDGLPVQFSISFNFDPEIHRACLLLAGYQHDQPRGVDGKWTDNPNAAPLGPQEKGNLLKHAHGDGEHSAQAQLALKAHSKGMHAEARWINQRLPKFEEPKKGPSVQDLERHASITAQHHRAVAAHAVEKKDLDSMTPGSAKHRDQLSKTLELKGYVDKHERDAKATQAFLESHRGTHGYDTHMMLAKRRDEHIAKFGLHGEARHGLNDLEHMILSNLKEMRDSDTVSAARSKGYAPVKNKFGKMETPSIQHDPIMKTSHFSGPYHEGFIKDVKAAGGRWSPSEKTWTLRGQNSSAQMHLIASKHFDHNEETHEQRKEIAAKRQVEEKQRVENEKAHAEKEFTDLHAKHGSDSTHKDVLDYVRNNVKAWEQYSYEAQADAARYDKHMENEHTSSFGFQRKAKEPHMHLGEVISKFPEAGAQVQLEHHAEDHGTLRTFAEEELKHVASGKKKPSQALKDARAAHLEHHRGD